MTEYSNERNTCSFCPKMCHFSCPVAEEEKNELYTPWGKQQNAKLIDEKILPLNVQNATPAFMCNTCRVSESFCDHKVPVADSLQELREQAVKYHSAPEEVFRFREMYKKHNNPYNKDLQNKLKKILEGSEYGSSRASTVFFASCHLLANLPELLGIYFELFRKLGIGDLKVFDDNIQCCGFSVYQSGFKEEFEDMAEVQWNSLRYAERIVVASPECAYAFKHLYPKFGFKFSGAVLTVSEFVASYLKNIPFKAKAKTPIQYFYHDSCYQGRYLKQYDEAREVLEMVTGFEPHEFSWNKEEGLCSGAGGTYALLRPEQAKNIAQRHLQEMKDKDVKMLVSSCPKSVQHFKQSFAGSGVVVKDFIGFLAENVLGKSWVTPEKSVKTNPHE